MAKSDANGFPFDPVPGPGLPMAPACPLACPTELGFARLASMSARNHNDRRLGGSWLRRCHGRCHGRCGSRISHSSAARRGGAAGRGQRAASARSARRGATLARHLLLSTGMQILSPCSARPRWPSAIPARNLASTGPSSGPRPVAGSREPGSRCSGREDLFIYPANAHASPEFHARCFCFLLFFPPKTAA